MFDDFCDYVFNNIELPDEFQGLNFSFIHEIHEIYIPQKFACTYFAKGCTTFVNVCEWFMTLCKWLSNVLRNKKML